MTHKVQCMDCGKTERIEVKRGLPNGGSDWGYYGKIRLNSCATDKHFFKIREGGTMLNPKDWIKVSNPNYNSAVKRKMAEMWSCPQCLAKLQDCENAGEKK
jgi:hypothetical protein